jgi:hypothetical protein
MQYESWRGGGIEKAKACERELRESLGREPTKRDFREAGKGNVWAALYRHRRKLSSSDDKECGRDYTRIREGLLESKKLMKKMVSDVCATLGPDEVEVFVEEFRKKRGLR